MDAGTFTAFLCLVRLNKLQLYSPSSSHYISRGGESIYGAKMNPLPLCKSKALIPLSLTRRCNLTSTPVTGATKIRTRIYVELVQCNKWWTHMYKCNLHSSFSTSVCFDIFVLHISVKVLLRVTVCSCQINSPECSLGRFHCRWVELSKSWWGKECISKRWLWKTLKILHYVFYFMNYAPFK